MKRLESEPTPEAIAASIESDAAGRNDELVDFIKILDTVEGPFNLFLDAPWGDGKTFFVRSIEEVLKALNPQITPSDEMDPRLTPVTERLSDIETPYLPFYFNAWENDFADDPVSALFANMSVAFDAVGMTKEHSAKKALGTIVDAAIAVAPIPTPVATIAKGATEALIDASNAIAGESLIEAYEKRSKLRSLIDVLATKSTLEVANKLVIIIDELDRCRPDFAVRLLEQTKSLFQSENIIVVISADSAQLAHATAGLYGPGYDSQRFLERFYDLRLQLEPSDPYKVVEGHRHEPNTHKYDLMVSALRRSHSLTIRDWMRLKSELDAGFAFCCQPDDSSIIAIASKCLLVPLLIFLRRDDYEAFRDVVNGQDYDALYALGSKHQVFLESLAHCTAAPDWPKIKGEDGRRLPMSGEEFTRNVAIWLYAATDSEEYREAESRLTGSIPYNFNKTVLKTLRFPPSCMQG